MISSAITHFLFPILIRNRIAALSLFFQTTWSSLFLEQISRSLDVLYIVVFSFFFSVYLGAFWSSLHDVYYFIFPAGMVIRDTKTAMYISVPARGPNPRIRSEPYLALHRFMYIFIYIYIYICIYICIYIYRYIYS